MRLREPTLNSAAVAALLLALPVTALAYEHDVEEPADAVFSDLELSLDFGVLDRGTTGVGEPLLGYGYDHGGGPVAGVAARLHFAADNRYFRHGVGARVSHQAAGDFGISGAFGFASTELDLTYSFRTSLPCMSGDDLSFYLTGFIGLSGVTGNAGTGEGPQDDNWNARAVAAHDLDFVGLGGILGLNLDMHRGPVLIGLVLDVREHFALEAGPVTRNFATSARIRWGVDLSL